MIRNMRGLRIFIALFCLASISTNEMESPQPVGYLQSDIISSSSVTFTGTTNLTDHLVNISDAPLLLQLDHLTYSNSFIDIGIPGKEDHGVWGPEVATLLWKNRTHIHVSGEGPPGDYRFRWPRRPGLIILRDEGYARIITLRPGWLNLAQTPSPIFKNDMRHLAIDASPVIDVSLPVLKPDSVQPGRPVIFDTAQPVYALGCQLIPFTYSDPKLVPAQPPVPEPVAVVPEHALELRVEVPEPVEAERDVTAIYLVGNTGSKPVWVVQNRMVPALATWEIVRDAKTVATIDGDSLRPLLDLLPAREPLLINPGEYLTWRRVLLASQLPLRRGNRATIRARLDVPWFTAEPKPDQEPAILTLSGTLDVTVQQAQTKPAVPPGRR